MQALYDYLYEPGFSLKVMGFVVGLWLILSHGFALLKPDLVKTQLKAFPRNEKAGVPMVIVGFAWALILWSGMDLGEFFKIEKSVQAIIIGVCVGVIIYVKEFIAVRALGFLMILAAAPILDAAFLKDPQSRLLLVAFAYAIALKGMFWVGMPYLMRDQINWLLAERKRYLIGAGAGVAYGVVVLICAILWW
ncbi:MAG: hypothetical protein P1U81_11210 [Verrucomicrobiales bacterium]|jgi:hypothetical protein|nr:hypothetical protein [Verrucomicrobiales bacterium]